MQRHNFIHILLFVATIILFKTEQRKWWVTHILEWTSESKALRIVPIYSIVVQQWVYRAGKHDAQSACAILVHIHCVMIKGIYNLYKWCRTITNSELSNARLQSLMVLMYNVRGKNEAKINFSFLLFMKLKETSWTKEGNLENNRPK